MTLPSGVCIVASQSHIARLQASGAAGTFGGVEFVAVPASEPVPSEAIARVRLLVVEVDPAERASMRRVAQVREGRPDLPLIVAIPGADMALMRTLIRQGVSDVASLPFDADELLTQVLDVAAQVQHVDVSPGKLAPLTLVVRSTGGCGATTVATHLAAAIAAQSNRRGVCLIDLDLQFGAVASMLGENAKVSVTELLEAGERIDAALLRSATIESKHGFALIAAPETITPLETVDSDQLLKLLTVARREFEHVLVDLPANWTNWTLSAALAATNVLLLTDLTIPGLRQAKRRLALFETVGLARENVRIVVNRVEKRLFRAIGMDEVKAALGREVYASLAAEPALLSTAQDQGLLAGGVNRKSRFVSDVARLAAMLTDGRN